MLQAALQKALLALMVAAPCLELLPGCSQLQVPTPEQGVSVALYSYTKKRHDRLLHYTDSQENWGAAMRGYLRSAPPGLCIGLLRNNHGIIIPAVSTQVMQHQETSRWQQLKQVDILAMNLHTPDRVSYTHCAIDSLPSHDAMEFVSYRQDGQEVIIEVCAVVVCKINTIIFDCIAVYHIPA